MNQTDTGKPILLVDDDRVVLAALAMGLSEMGFLVEKAASGEEAVQKCLQLGPAIAVLDVNMPGMSGIEAARRIRETSGTPVMFLSAYDEKALVEQAVAEGGLGYLVKPIRINQLVPAIMAALARAAELDRLEDARDNLSRALEGDRSINLAMGILMERHHLSSEAAFDALRQRARNEGRKLGELAKQIAAAADLLSSFGQGRPAGSGQRRKTDRTEKTE
ncbi:MAG: response regulator [Rhodocyclales bacterium]|nr:response regulator [Rhodocyclales bacterium]